jgi:sodium/pantothenate symporter
VNGIASSGMVVAGWVLLCVYSAAVLLFVVRGALRTRSMADYAVGSIAFSPLLVGMSLAASMMSAATFIINPGLIAVGGLSGVLSYAVVLPLAAVTSLVVITKGFRRQGTVVKATTLAQWIGSRYGSRGYALFFAVLALLLVTFIVLICVGLTKVLSKTLNADELYVLAGVVVFVFGYMMFGGANSMVYTNAIQAGLMLVVAVVLLGSGHQHFADGVSGFLERLRAIDPNLVRPTNPTSYLFRDTFEIILCQIVIGVAIVCQPHIVTRSLFLKSDRDVNRYLVVSVVLSLVFFWVVFVGLYARIDFPDLKVGGVALKVDGIVSAYVVKRFPVYVGIVVVMGLIAAGISTLEGLIQSVSATITTDLIGFFRKQPAGVALNRAVIGGLGLVAGLLSWRQLVAPEMSVAIFAQNGVYAYFAAAFVPVLFGTFLRKVPPRAPMAASVTAVAVHFAVYYGELTSYMAAPVKNPAIPGALAILAALGTGSVLQLFVISK